MLQRTTREPFRPKVRGALVSGPEILADASSRYQKMLIFLFSVSPPPPLRVMSRSFCFLVTPYDNQWRFMEVQVECFRASQQRVSKSPREMWNMLRVLRVPPTCSRDPTFFFFLAKTVFGIFEVTNWAGDANSERKKKTW